MIQPLTSETMRAIEAAAIGSGAVTGLELMERAGRGVVEALLNRWPDHARKAGRAIVVCGPGNNGGDGFVIARLLHHRGWKVRTVLLGRPENLPPDARTNHDRWRAIGDVETAATAPAADAALDLVIDAAFGTGLTRPVTVLEDLALSLLRLGDRRPRVVAVDIPSGLDADTGRWLRTAGGAPEHTLAADLTVTFHRPKIGHGEAAGPAACGQVVVADIGIAPWDDGAP